MRTLILLLGIVVGSCNGCESEFFQLPECLDRPHGYDCDCGAGFAWNSRQCVAAGLDSRLSFEARTPVAYTVLKRKTGLPALYNFTISVWLRPTGSGTVVSYAGPNDDTWLRIYYWGSLNSSGFEVKLLDTNLTVELSAPIIHWTHIMWIHRLSVRGTRWEIFINGTARTPPGGHPASDRQLSLPERGDLVLGQSPRDSKGQFDTIFAFVGDMAHFNLWKHPLEPKLAKRIFNDYTFMYCGDEVEWSQFRHGTRGKMRLRWPSSIFDSSRITPSVLRQTCDKDCSQRIGAQCKSEVQENILWPRTKANDVSQVPCPGFESIPASRSENETSMPLYATRFCNVTEDQEGKWEYPNITRCISEFLESEGTLTEDTDRQSTICQMNMADIIDMEDIINNITSENRFFNPVDLSVVSKNLGQMVQLRRKLRQGISCTSHDRRSSRIHLVLAKMDDIIRSLNATASILDHLLASKNGPGWNLTRPPGLEAVHLTRRIDEFLDEAVIELFQAMDREATLTPEQAEQLIVKDNILLKVRMQRKVEFHGAALPDDLDIESREAISRYEAIATAAVQSRLFIWDNGSSVDVSGNYSYITAILAMYPYLQFVIPNSLMPNNLRRNTGEVQHREKCVNSAVVQIRLYTDAKAIPVVEIPLKIKFYYSNSHNISNVDCVRLETKDTYYQWSTKDCVTSEVTEEYVICSCTRPGFLAVLSDMYDVNWKRDVKRNPLVETPSYVGCSISALLCFTAFLMLNYYRTSSNTASIHKHFSLAVVGGQLAFMIGIDKYQHPLMCQTFAVLLHYFFLASLSWLMNEAFNLYIVITYAAHSHGDHTEGSMWRYYVLGWLVPAILVLAFVLANKGDYYAENMCWIQWKHVWLFVGPAITIIAITILVLTFTAKEHHESSYTKNEKANRSIVIQTKALWTQVILLSIAWCFAFITVKMRGAMLKYLYMVFNCLQGLFFIVFYFLLNEEVQSIHSDNQKRHVLEMEGIGSEEDDDVFVTEIATVDDVHGSSPRHHSVDEGRRSRSRTPKRTSSRKTRHRKNDTDLSDDENSDCEMIVTSV